MSATATLIRQRIEAALPEVEKRELFDANGNTTGHYGLFRLDNGRCVGSAVSRLYVPHTRDEVILTAEAAAAAFDGAEDILVTARFERDAHNLIVGPTKSHRLAIFGKKDNLFPRLIIRAGFDGVSFSARLGAYRDLCRNLHAVASKSESVGRFRHVGSLSQSIEQLAEDFRGSAAGFGALAARAVEMQGRTLHLGEFADALFPRVQEATDQQELRRSRRLTAILDRILRERQELGGSQPAGIATAWEAYNGVQGWVQHEATRKGPQDPVSRALNAVDDPRVTRAWDLALAMAS